MLAFKKQFIVTLIILIISIFLTIVILSNSLVAQNNSSLQQKSEPNKTEPKKSETSKPETKVQQIAGLNAKFIVALISDGEGGAWIGTEDEGVFRYNNIDGKISQFTTKNGLGDNNGYALAIDKLGRLWVGHLNTGVSVFNGNNWKNYDVVDGPIGERIFDIKICPKDGDVWMATSAGISRYRIDTDEWEHFTREDGLLEDQASVLAFKNDGTLIVGTQSHGLAIFNRNPLNGNYKFSKNILATDRFGPNNCSPVPLTPIGNNLSTSNPNLPSNLINDIIVTKNSEDETIWIATNAGLVKLNNDFSKLDFWRGKNYADKVRGLYGGAPKDFKQAPKEIMDQLLPEDYLTCLAEDEQGVIWIGTRQSGTLVSDPKTGVKSYGTIKGMNYPDNFVTKILLLDHGDYLVGFYGGGIVKSMKPFKLVERKPEKTRFNRAKIFSVTKNNFPKLPLPIKPPTGDKFKSILTKLERLKTPLPKVYAAYLGEDWKTQGDWIGRTFRDWAILCAVVAPFDHPIYFNTEYYSVHEFIGPNYREKDDVIRRWIHWAKTDNPKTLYDPYYGYRRQAEWDDHGEAYPWSLDGPDIWYLLRIREPGTYKIGMYFFNKDGHDGNNRMRDYSVEIYPSLQNWKMEEWSRYKSSDWKIYSKYAESLVSKTSPLAKFRVRDFWGGVHKQFVVTGQGYYFVKIDRNYSFNTIVSSVSIDRLHGKPTYEERMNFGIPCLPATYYDPPPLPKKVYETTNGHKTALLWKLLDDKYAVKGGIEVQRKNRIAAYQAAIAYSNEEENVEQLAKAIKWYLNQWDEDQRQGWKAFMKRGHAKFLHRIPEQRDAIESYEKQKK